MLRSDCYLCFWIFCRFLISLWFYFLFFRLLRKRELNQEQGDTAGDQATKDVAPPQGSVGQESCRLYVVIWCCYPSLHKHFGSSEWPLQKVQQSKCWNRCRAHHRLSSGGLPRQGSFLLWYCQPVMQPTHVLWGRLHLGSRAWRSAFITSNNIWRKLPNTLWGDRICHI